ncbi:MAG: glutathione S-transferase family protein [Gammaproteobacteria bacterium]
MPSIEFYDNDMSVCAQKVRLVLATKGLDYTRHALDLRAGDQFKPEYRKLNPKAVVPTIVDQGTPVIESTVIIAYLDDAYPEPSLKPADPFQRATMLRWMILPDASLHDACGITSFALAFRHQLAKLPPAALEAHYAKMPSQMRRKLIRSVVEQGLDAPDVGPALQTYVDSIQAMAAALADAPCVAGDTWSLADITMLPYVLRLDHLGLDWFWSDLPQVTDWFARAKRRPEFSAIEEHINPHYLKLMGGTTPEQHDKIRAAITA